jgi:hypothetical protein
MNTIKCFSLLIAGSLLSTAVLAQNAAAPVAELDVKPVVAKPVANKNIPAPGTRVVAVEQPVDALKAPAQPQAIKTEAAPNDLVQPSPIQAAEVLPINAEPVAMQIPDVSAKQAKMTEQQKATMAGKGIRPKSIDQTSGATESKLTPVAPLKPLVAPVAAEPVKEN